MKTRKKERKTSHLLTFLYFYIFLKHQEMTMPELLFLQQKSWSNQWDVYVLHISADQTSSKAQKNKPIEAQGFYL